MTRSHILSKADGDRAEAYGDATVSLGRIAGLWSAFLGVEISASDAAAMMVLLKMSRTRGGSDPDNWIDAAGYAALGGELAE
jgi:hypothetical protein